MGKMPLDIMRKELKSSNVGSSYLIKGSYKASTTFGGPSRQCPQSCTQTHP
jgi:hypothetical protein